MYMSDWVASLGYDLDIIFFQFVGGKRRFVCKTLMTSFSSSIVMGYGGGKQGVCEGDGA